MFKLSLAVMLSAVPVFASEKRFRIERSGQQNLTGYQIEPNTLTITEVTDALHQDGMRAGMQVVKVDTHRIDSWEDYCQTAGELQQFDLYLVTPERQRIGMVEEDQHSNAQRERANNDRQSNSGTSIHTPQRTSAATSSGQRETSQFFSEEPVRPTNTGSRGDTSQTAGASGNTELEMTGQVDPEHQESPRQEPQGQGQSSNCSTVLQWSAIAAVVLTVFSGASYYFNWWPCRYIRNWFRPAKIPQVLPKSSGWKGLSSLLRGKRRLTESERILGRLLDEIDCQKS